MFYIKDDGQKRLTSKILKIAIKNKIGKYEIVQSVKPNQECVIILDKTFFYPESGGQASDRGCLKNLKKPNLEFKINNVVHVQGFSFHEGKIICNDKQSNESFDSNDTVECFMDKKFRYNTSLNHTGINLK
jgi:alanyl-tRNA synthetase